MLDQVAEQPDHPRRLTARRGPQVDALEVEGPELRQRGRRRFGHPDRAGAVDGVEHRAEEHADLRRRPGPDDRAHAGGEIVGIEDAGPHRVVEVVAHVGDAVGPRHDLAFGRGRRRPTPRVVAHAVERLQAEVERGQRDVGAVDRVVVAGTGQERRERLLGRVPGGPVPAVVGQRDGLHQRQAQVGGPGDAGGHLRHLDRVGEAGAEVVVLRGDEDLALPRQPPPGSGVLDPVEVALEAQPPRVGVFRPGPHPGADRPGRAGGQRPRQLALPLLPPAHGCADERRRARRGRGGPPGAH